MHSKDQLYQKIKDIKTEKEYEKEITRIKQESHDLLDDNTAALLYIDKIGRNEPHICKIRDLKPQQEYTVIGTVTKIDDSKTFKRKNGATGRVINLEISDDTGSCNLVLWNKDVALVKNKNIRIGTTIKLINGYTKDGLRGLEINLGRWGLLEVELNNEKEHMPDELTGTLVEILPTCPFFKDSGDFGFVTNIKLQTEHGIKEIIIWDDKVKEIQCFKPGQKIKLTDYQIRSNNGKMEIHINSNSKIKKN